jgi:hypothetical protein
MSKSRGGYSPSARKRRRRAAALSQQMRRGDGNAAFRLLQRGRAFKGLAKGGWGWRLALANAARQGKYKQRLAAAAVAAERQRLEAQCRVTPAMLAALRARYGTGGLRRDYAEGECRPVAPGGTCSACGWRWAALKRIGSRYHKRKGCNSRSLGLALSKAIRHSRPGFGNDPVCGNSGSCI